MTMKLPHSKPALPTTTINPVVRNLTPHPISVYDDEIRLITLYQPEDTPARLKVKSITCGGFQATTGDDRHSPVIPFFKSQFGETTDLPAAEENVLIIVSAMVREANKDRKDLISPARVIRGEAGTILGCSAFDTNL